MPFTDAGQAEIKAGVLALRDRMESRMDRLESKLDEKLGVFKAEIDARFAALETKFDNRFESLESKLDRKFMWMLAFGAGILATMARGFGWL